MPNHHNDKIMKTKLEDEYDKTKPVLLMMDI